MRFGNLDFALVADKPELLAEPVKQAIEKLSLKGVQVAEIDPNLSDTAAFCEHYRVALSVSANCVIVEAKRGDRVWYGACMIPADQHIDVNNLVRRYLGARKISFAPMDRATSMTNMEFGGITPIGLPADWPILVESQLGTADWLILGSGLRKSKLLVKGSLLAQLPGAVIMPIAK